MSELRPIPASRVEASVAAISGASSAGARAADEVDEEESKRRVIKIISGMSASPALSTRSLTSTRHAEMMAMRNKPWYIMTPNQWVYKLWSPVQSILILYAVVFIPIFIAYDFDTDNNYDLVRVTWFFDIMFLIDLAMNFCRAFHDPKTRQLVVEPGAIRRSYLKSWFLLDFIASVPPVALKLAGTAGADSAKLGRVLRIARLLRLSRVAKVAKIGAVVDTIESSFQLNAGAVRLTKTLFFLSVLTHLVGCIFHGIALLEESPYGWDAARNVRSGDCDDCCSAAKGQDCGFSAKYLNSLYWAFTTLTTVGYGDISATTNWEIGFSILVMILGVTIYSLILSSVNSAMAAFDTSKAYEEGERNKIVDFTRAAKLPRELAHRCREHVTDMMENGKALKMKDEDRDAALATLTPQLRNECIKHVYRELLQDLPFFKRLDGNKSLGDFMCSVLPQLRVSRVHDGVTLCNEATPANEVIFLSEGMVEVNREGACIGIMHGGCADSHFGFLAALRNGEFRSTVVSCDHVSFYSLDCDVLRKSHTLLERKTAEMVRKDAGSFEARLLWRSAVKNMIKAKRLTGKVSFSRWRKEKQERRRRNHGADEHEGAAASDERIVALEESVRELTRTIHEMLSQRQRSDGADEAVPAAAT